MPDRVVNIRDFRSTIDGQERLRFPPDIVRVDRRSKWGNPFAIGAPDPDTGHPMTRDDVLRHYRGWLLDMLAPEPTFIEPLRGKRLACWCAPERCHADVIIEVEQETA